MPPRPRNLYCTFYTYGNRMYVKSTCITECMKRDDEKTRKPNLIKTSPPLPHGRPGCTGSGSFVLVLAPPVGSEGHGKAMARRKWHRVYGAHGRRYFDPEDLMVGGHSLAHISG